MSKETLTFGVELEQGDGYEFRVRFDTPGAAELLLDEPPPLGGGHGPNAARLIAAAVANCLSASLVFCLRGKFKQNAGPVRAMATGRLEKNERGRYRIADIDVVLSLSEKIGELVTESVRRGIPVSVSVVDAQGNIVHRAGAPVPA